MIGTAILLLLSLLLLPCMAIFTASTYIKWSATILLKYQVPGTQQQSVHTKPYRYVPGVNCFALPHETRLHTAVSRHQDGGKTKGPSTSQARVDPKITRTNCEKRRPHGLSSCSYSSFFIRTQSLSHENDHCCCRCCCCRRCCYCSHSHFLPSRS